LGEGAAVTDLTTERATEARGPGLPAEASDRHEQPGEPLSAPPGVALTRLISLARLTPAQALEIGVSLLAEAATRSEPRTGSAGSPRVQADRSVVGADGRVVLGPAPDDRDGNPPAAARSSVEAVLADVVAAARLHERRADPQGEQFLAALDRAVVDLPRAGVPVVAQRLRDAAGAIDRPAMRAELAALVGALGESAAASAGGGGAVGAPTHRDPARRTTTRETRTVARRVGAWVASVLVLSAVVLLEVVLLRDDISTDIDVLLQAGRSGSESSADPEPDGLPIRAPAPAAAGNVTAVDLRALASCRPGMPCALRLQVGLVPGTEQQAVTWSYRIVDRCTGATTTAPGGTVTVPARGARAAAVGTVALPKIQAVAVVAVTETPAVAASAPVHVGSCLPERRAG
jgi:hypothetical protein